MNRLRRLLSAALDQVPMGCNICRGAQAKFALFLLVVIGLAMLAVNWLEWMMRR